MALRKLPVETLYPGLGLIHGTVVNFDTDHPICGKCGFDIGYTRDELLAYADANNYEILATIGQRHRDACV